MEFRLCFLVFVSLFAGNYFALADKDAEIVVNEENQEEYGVPVGTKLELDERTQRYKPPPLTNSFSAEDRYQIMWKDPITYNNYCKQGPTLHRSVFKRMRYSYFYYSWCLKEDVDLCCDNKKCTCTGWRGSDCSCLTDEMSSFYIEKQKKDKKLATGVFKFGFKVVKNIVEANSNKEPENKE